MQDLDKILPPSYWLTDPSSCSKCRMTAGNLPSGGSIWHNHFRFHSQGGQCPLNPSLRPCYCAFTFALIMSCLHQCRRRPASPIPARMEALVLKGTNVFTVVVLMDTPGSSAKPVNVTANAANRSVMQTPNHSLVIVIWFNDFFFFCPHQFLWLHLDIAWIFFFFGMLISLTNVLHRAQWLLHWKRRDVQRCCQCDRQQAWLSRLDLLFHSGTCGGSFHNVLWL